MALQPRDPDWSIAQILKIVRQPIAARRTFILLPFGMVFGLCAYATLPFEPNGWALFAVGLGLVGLLALSWRWEGLALLVPVAAFWMGFCLLPLHGATFGTPMLIYPAYGEYEARVDEVLSATGETRRLVVSDLVPLGTSRALPIVKTRLVVPPEPALSPGDRIRARMRLAPVPGPVLPGSYDGQFHSFFAGVGAYGTVTSGFSFIAEGSAADPFRGIEIVRELIGVRIDAALDGPSEAIGRAMVMGDQGGITDETREVMAASGLAHIYSISGLHLSIVAGGVFWLVRLILTWIPWVSIHWPLKKIAAGAGLIAALGYMLLAGGVNNVPALRSAIMLGLIFGAVLAGRRALTMRNVAIAGLAIILIDPASVFRASFQLSFAAVVALIGIYETPRKPRTADRGRLGKIWDAVWTTALTSLIAGTATLLFSAYHFQQTAPLGVLGNVLVLPVVSLIIMPAAVLGVLAMPFGVEGPFLVVMGWGIDRMLEGANLVASWSEGLTGNPLLTQWALVLGLIGLTWFAFFNNRWRFVGPVLAVPLILAVGIDQRPDVLVADTTQAVAVRNDEILGLASGRPGSFAVNAWSKHYQEEIAASVPGLRCDSLGCIVNAEQFSIAVVRNAAALAEDCGRHDLIIARFDVPKNCVGGQVIAGKDLAASGVHWLRWDDGAGRFEIRPAIPNLTRPWRVVPR